MENGEPEQKNTHRLRCVSLKENRIIKFLSSTFDNTIIFHTPHWMQ